MHCPSLLPLLLLPTALATRYRHGHGYGRAYHHHRSSGTAYGPGVVKAVGTGAPYALGNSTGIIGSNGSVSGTSITTVLNTSTQTVIDTVFATVDAAQTGDSAVSTSPQIADAATCGSTVTVTEESSDIVTVTVDESSSITEASSAVLSTTEQDTQTTTKTASTTIIIGQSSSTSVQSYTSTSEQAEEQPTTTKQTTITVGGSSTSEVSTSATPSTSSPVEVQIPPSPSPSSTEEATSQIPSSTEEATTKASPSTTTTLLPVKASSTPSKATPNPFPPASSLSSSSAGDCPSKRGIIATAGGPNHDQANISLAFASAPKVCWIANWYSSPPPLWNPAKEFIPQDYGPSSDEKGWHDNAAQAIARAEKTFFSFGEPEAPGRDHMSPDQAVDLFMKLMQPYAEQGVKICSPAVLQPRPDMDWLASFLPKCEARGCTISMICVHWFDTTSAATPGFPEFKRTVENATALANGKKVWVDNFQANGSPEDVKAFLDEALPYLEGNDNVERYAYVPPLRTDPSKSGSGFRTDQFIDPDLASNGTLTELGKYYADF